MNQLELPISKRMIICHALGLSVLLSFTVMGPALSVSNGAETAPGPKSAKIPGPARADTFAPLPEDHALASIWNDPDFAKRLIGSYGFASGAEPIMTPEEQKVYRETVVPALTNSASDGCSRARARAWAGLEASATSAQL